MADAPKILGTDTLRKMYPKVNSAIDNSNDALKKSTTAETKSSSALTTANVAKTTAESTQKQLNDIIIESGTSDAEVIQARGNSPVLNERLNFSESDLRGRGLNVKYPPAPFVAAQGDGATNDTAAIQAIISYGQQNGVPVYIPEGIFLCNLKINGWGIDLSGATSLNTVLRPFDSSLPVITDDGVMLRNSKIKNLKLLGNNLPGEIGLHFRRNSYLCSYENITAENFDVALDLAGVWGLNFHTFETKNNTTGIKIDAGSVGLGGVNAVQFNNCKISGNTVGVDFVNQVGHTIKFENTTIEGNTTGVRLKNLYGNLKFDNCYIEANEKHLLAQANSTSQSAAIEFDSCFIYAHSTNQIEFLSDLQNVNFNNCEFTVTSTIATILKFKKLEYLGFTGSTVVSYTNVTDGLFTVVESIGSYNIPSSYKVGGVMQSQPKISARNLDLSNNVKYGDSITLTSLSMGANADGSGAVDSGKFYRTETKVKKNSGRMTIETVALIRGGAEKTLSMVTENGNMKINGGVQYLYSTERPTGLNNGDDRGYMVFDRTINKLITWVGTGWKDAMGNDV